MEANTLPSSSSTVPSTNEPPSTPKRRYIVGLILLGFVICLWVGSSTLIQAIFDDMKFHQPFFLTYYSTSLFTLYLPFFYLRRWCRQHCTMRCCLSERSRMRHERSLLLGENEGDQRKATQTAAASSSSSSPTPHTPVMQHSNSSPSMSGYTTYSSNISPRRIEIRASEAVPLTAEEAPNAGDKMRSVRTSDFQLWRRVSSMEL